MIRLASPALDLVLAAGERLSRIVEREDPDYYPPRVTREETPAVGAKSGPADRTGRP